MSVTKKRILKLTALALVMILIYVFLSWFLIRTSSTTEAHIRNFYKEPENSMDVAFIGASEMYADYSAPLAYKKYGYTGYNFCYEGAPCQLYIPMIETYLRHQDPQLIVIEINGFLYSQKHCEKDVGYMKLFANMPYSSERFEYVNKYVPEDKRLGYSLPLIDHHSNWRFLPNQVVRAIRNIRSDANGVSLTKSFGTRTSTNSQKAHYSRDRKKARMYDYGKVQLEETIRYLKEKGVKNVLFIRAPHKQSIKKSSLKEMKKIITDGGYEFLNCDKLTEEIGLDFSTDFYNDEHLNVFGNEKFTDYLGGYITSHYDIKTSHTEEVDKQWQECADFTSELFEKLKVKTLNDEDRLYYEENAEYA